MRRNIDPLILALCIVWIAILGWLGISAITQQHLSIGTRFGISTSGGRDADILGLILVGFALLGLVPLLDRNRFRKNIAFLIAACWLVGSAVVLYRWH